MLLLLKSFTDLSWGTRRSKAEDARCELKSIRSYRSIGVGMLSRMKDVEDAQRKATREAEELAITYRVFRSQFLMGWIALNFASIAVCKAYDPNGSTVLLGLLVVVATVNCFRLAGSVFFVLGRSVEWLGACCAIA